MKTKRMLFFYLFVGVLLVPLLSDRARTLIISTYYLIDSKDGLVYSRPFFRETIERNTVINQKDRVLIFLTYGQSNAANASNFKYKTKYDVYEFWNDRIYKYKEPSLGASGGGGSVWGLVGDKLIEANAADKVIFMNAAVGGASMEDLAYEESGISTEFINRYKKIEDVLIGIDAILFHQGESNINDSSGYEKAFMYLKSKLQDISSTPIILANVSYCEGVFDDELKKIQDNLISTNKDVLRGPDTDKLLSDFRYDDCHFNKHGLDKLSDYWVNSIIDVLN